MAPTSDPATAGNDDPVAKALFGDQLTPVGRRQTSYPYSFERTESKRKIVEQGTCAMKDSLGVAGEAVHGNALKSKNRGSLE